MRPKVWDEGISVISQVDDDRAVDLYYHRWSYWVVGKSVVGSDDEKFVLFSHMILVSHCDCHTGHAIGKAPWKTSTVSMLGDGCYQVYEVIMVTLDVCAQALTFRYPSHPLLVSMSPINTGYTFQVVMVWSWAGNIQSGTNKHDPLFYMCKVHC